MVSDTDVLVRLSTDADGDPLAAVIAEIFAQYPHCPFDREAEFPELDAIASHFDRLKGRLWVAEDARGVAGSFGIAPTADPGIFEFYKVYLLPRCRGRGAAKRMLGLAMDFARDNGASAVRLWTDTRFLEGHAFYERNGFKRLPVRRYLADLGHTWEYGFKMTLREWAKLTTDA